MEECREVKCKVNDVGKVFRCRVKGMNVKRWLEVV